MRTSRGLRLVFETSQFSIITDFLQLLPAITKHEREAAPTTEPLLLRTQQYGSASTRRRRRLRNEPPARLRERERLRVRRRARVVDTVYAKRARLRRGLRERARETFVELVHCCVGVGGRLCRRYQGSTPAVSFVPLQGIASPYALHLSTRTCITRTPLINTLEL